MCVCVWGGGVDDSYQGVNSSYHHTPHHTASCRRGGIPDLLHFHLRISWRLAVLMTPRSRSTNQPFSHHTKVLLFHRAERSTAATYGHRARRDMKGANVRRLEHLSVFAWLISCANIDPVHCLPVPPPKLCHFTGQYETTLRHADATKGTTRRSSTRDD